MVAKSVPSTLGKLQPDAQGPLLLLKGKVQDVQITFANVYFLNMDHLQFLQDLPPVLLFCSVLFSEGLLVFGGVLNFAMDRLLDVLWGTFATLTSND